MRKMREKAGVAEGAVQAGDDTAQNWRTPQPVPVALFFLACSCSNQRLPRGPQWSRM
ncbi:hypothetical protein OV450_2466 [Actinobacteria bacterium OV450]|nr:hypothetical protein OV450_2466 [Actinobacteria bacterium OV450]